MCGSRKYPYPHHRENFTYAPPPLPWVSIFIWNYEPFGTTQSIRVTFKPSRIETYGYLEQGNIDFFVYLTQLLDIPGGPGYKISYETLFNTRSVLLGSI